MRPCKHTGTPTGPPPRLKREGGAAAGQGGTTKGLSVEELERGQGVGVGQTPAANADSNQNKTLEQAFWDSLVSKK